MSIWNFIAKWIEFNSSAKRNSDASAKLRIFCCINIMYNLMFLRIHISEGFSVPNNKNSSAVLIIKTQVKPSFVHFRRSSRAQRFMMSHPISNIPFIFPNASVIQIIRLPCLISNTNIMKMNSDSLDKTSTNVNGWLWTSAIERVREREKVCNWMIQGRLCVWQSPYQRHLVLPYHITAIQHTLDRPPLIMNRPCPRDNAALIICIPDIHRHFRAGRGLKVQCNAQIMRGAKHAFGYHTRGWTQKKHLTFCVLCKPRDDTGASCLESRKFR